MQPQHRSGIGRAHPGAACHAAAGSFVLVVASVKSPFSFCPFRPAMSASRSLRSMTSFDRGHLRRGIHRGEASLLPAVRRLGDPRGRDLAVARTCYPPLARGDGAWLRERNLFGHRSAPSPKNSRRLASAAANALPRSESTSASDLISGHAPRYSCSKLARR